jgi:hypothetical protein
MFKWLLREAWEKINIKHAYQEIKALGKKHGRRFFWAALIWEGIEDIVFPYLSWLFGVPELIPVFLVLHFEPIVYPAFFWGFKTWDRIQGKEPWEPNRGAYSYHWRSLLKGLSIHLSIVGWLSHIIPWREMIVFTVLMSLFGFIHERIWHDHNYGIQSNDLVYYRRPIAKTGTYLFLSSFILVPMIRIAGLVPAWRPLLLSLLVEGALYLVLETVWAKSVWGVVFSHQDDHEEHR